MLDRSLFVLAVAFLPATALAFQNEPDGFGGARFGMSIEQVKEVFPALEEFGTSPDGAFAMYTAEGQSFDGLESCKVTFGFIADQLYEAKFDCGREDRVVALLRAKFGTPSVQEEKMTIWRGEKAVVSMNRQMKTFAFASPALTKFAHQYFLRRAITEGLGPQAQGEGSKQGEAVSPEQSGAGEKQDRPAQPGGGAKQDEPSSPEHPGAVGN